MGSAELQSVKDNSTGTKVKNGILGVILNVLLWVFSLICIFPLVWMLYSSLKDKREFNASIVTLPSAPSLENYSKLIANKDANLFGAMGNSARTTILSVLLIVLCAFIVGYILSRVQFRLNRPLYVMFLMGMLIPIHSLLVPIYIIFTRTRSSERPYSSTYPS